MLASHAIWRVIVRRRRAASSDRTATARRMQDGGQSVDSVRAPSRRSHVDQYRASSVRQSVSRRHQCNDMIPRSSDARRSRISRLHRASRRHGDPNFSGCHLTSLGTAAMRGGGAAAAQQHAWHVVRRAWRHSRVAPLFSHRHAVWLCDNGRPIAVEGRRSRCSRHAVVGDQIPIPASMKRDGICSGARD